MSNKELAEKLLETLKEKMWYQEGLPSDGWAIEKILEVLDAVEQSVQATMLDDGQIFKMPEPEIIARGRFVWDDPPTTNANRSTARCSRRKHYEG